MKALIAKTEFHKTYLLFERRDSKTIDVRWQVFIGTKTGKKEHDIEYSNVEYMDVPNVNTYGRKHSITMDGNVIPIIGTTYISPFEVWQMAWFSEWKYSYDDGTS